MDQVSAATGDDRRVKSADGPLAGKCVQVDPHVVLSGQPPTSKAPQASLMRTVLRRFSEAFDQRVRPLTEPLVKAVGTLTEVSVPTGAESILSDLRELAHHVQALIDKVAQQHAYVLIFGPLKSGKSTFMNALCRSYVSEVTSLPAYPCLVHVCHDNQVSYRISRYDGSTEQFEDAAALHQAVEAAHRALVERIRQVETGEDQFDPDTHMPEAIRRIDVKVTADDLAQSGAVLVDTPGLYTRMKFGYDRMTRNFRNAAACVIFIVKADNLFLEQVFEEFHELLDLFSRIFLIVNIDATKKDLRPDGQLAPSLEHEDPQKIVKAFEDLAMSAGLKAAAEAGRLKIYPVDLLSAASRRLRSDGGSNPTPIGQADFDTLLGDLTQYLNSSDYLRAFMADSLRRAGMLLEQLHGLTGQSYMADLNDRVESLRRRHEAALVQRQATTRLGAVDWQQHPQSLLASLYAGSRQQAQQVQRTTGYALAGAIDAWFETDHSLAQLNDDEMNPLLAKAQTEFLDQLCDRVQQRLVSTPGGLNVSPAVISDLLTCGIELDAMAKQAIEKVDPRRRTAPPVSKLVGRDIPVRRRWWDWLLLRSKKAVADHFFGPSVAGSTRPIPAAAKARRLGTVGPETMKKLMVDQLDELMTRVTEHIPEQLCLDYTTQLTDGLDRVLRGRAERTTRELADLESQLDQAQRVLADLQSLRHCGQQTQDAVRHLTEQFGCDADVLGSASAAKVVEPVSAVEKD